MAAVKVKFSVKKLAAILAKTHRQRVDYLDAAYPSLYLRVGPRSAVWYLFPRVNRELVRLKLGTNDEFAAAGAADPKKPRASFTIARERAGAVEDQIAAGKHPKAEQARERAETQQAIRADEARIVRNVAKSWKENLNSDLAASTRKDYIRMVDAFVAEFGDYDIGTVRRADIKLYLAKVKRRSPAVANRSLVVLRMLFAHAVDTVELPANPAREIEKPAKVKPRTRTLTREEIRVLWRACELASFPYGTALQFALCTAQRIGEVGAIRRSDVDAEGYWTQTENKTDKRIDILIAPHARAALNACPEFASEKGERNDHYFSASGGKKGIRSDVWPQAIERHIAPKMAQAVQELGLGKIEKPWSTHDLRRTARTGMTGWAEVSPDTAERALNHAVTGLRAVYDHADYKSHVAEAMRSWDAEITRILLGRESVRAERDRKAARVAPPGRGKAA